MNPFNANYLPNSIPFRAPNGFAVPQNGSISLPPIHSTISTTSNRNTHVPQYNASHSFQLTNHNIFSDANMVPHASNASYPFNHLISQNSISTCTVPGFPQSSRPNSHFQNDLRYHYSNLQFPQQTPLLNNYHSNNSSTSILPSNTSLPLLCSASSTNNAISCGDGWSQTYSDTRKLDPVPQFTSTIVLENDENIQDVIMADDYDYGSDHSPYDPNEITETVSLLNIDYNLTKNKDQLLSNKGVAEIFNDKDLRIIDPDKMKNNEINVNIPNSFEHVYWESTHDCDYRTVDENLRLHKHLSRKKYKKLKKKNEIYHEKIEQTNPDDEVLNLKKKENFFETSNVKKNANNKSTEKRKKTLKTDSDLDLQDIDNLAYEDLINVYNQLKEELTVLSIDKNDSVELKNDDNNVDEEDYEVVSSLVPEPVDGDVYNLVDEFKIDSIAEELDSISDNDDPIVLDELSNFKKITEADINQDSVDVDQKEGSCEEEADVISDKVKDIDVDLNFALNVMDKELETESQAILSNSSESNDSDSDNILDGEKTNDKQRDDVMNENLLREQLIRTLLEKRMSKLAQHVNKHSCSVQNIKPKKSKEILKKVKRKNQLNAKTDKIDLTPPTNLAKTVKENKIDEKLKIDLSKYNLVIHLSDSSETEEDEQLTGKQNDDESLSFNDTHGENICESKMDICSNEESLTEQSTSQTVSTKQTSTVTKNGIIHKLSKSQQEEYQKLKKEIERRELKFVNNKSLTAYEMKFKETILSSNLKRRKMFGLNRKLVNFKKKLKKSKIRARKLQRLTMIANKNVKLFTVQMQLIMKEMKGFEQSLLKDNQLAKQYEQICQNIGTKIVGPQYSIPVVDDPHIPTSSKLKRRLKSFNEIKDNIVTKKNNNKETAQSLKYLRNKIKFLLNSSTHSYKTVLLFDHYVNFNFDLFPSTLFYRTSKLSVKFNDFTENRSEIFSSNLDKYCAPIQDSNLLMQNYQSVLVHFNSYRFASHQSGRDLVSDCWSNAVDPNKFICVFDLFGVCHDSNCNGQHQKDYIYDSQEKIIDILTYLPQLAEKINLEKLKSDPKSLKNALVAYAREVQKSDPDKTLSIDEVCHKICFDIQSQSKISVSSLLIRMFPKELVNFSDQVSTQNQHVPFDDYRYRFNVKDDSFELKLAEIINMKFDNDPDFYLKNRFFAPEGVPITAQLEASLSSDLHNIQMWINLAYYHLSKFSDPGADINYCLDSALNVLSRALEHNKSNSELYEQYLFLYSNKIDLVSCGKGQSAPQDMLDIQNISTRVLKFCSTYRLWICYLNLSHKVGEKQSISLQIINEFLHDNIQYDSLHQRSFNLLEIIFYRINLFIHLNQHEESVKFFNEIFNHRAYDDFEDEKKDNVDGFSRLNSFILKQHRVFAWLCYIHLILYRRLPYHCFNLGKNGGFIQLNNCTPFMFDWKSIGSENDLRLIEKMLKRALKNCCTTNDDLRCNCVEKSCFHTCFPLRLNMAHLSKQICSHAEKTGIDDHDEFSNSYYLSFIYNENREVLSHLHTLQLFDTDLTLDSDNDGIGAGGVGAESLNLIESFYNSYNQNVDQTELNEQQFVQLQYQIKFNYWLAYYQFKLHNKLHCKRILRKNLTYYFSGDVLNRLSSDVSAEDVDDSWVIQLYEVVLFNDCQDNDHEHEQRCHFSKLEQLKSSLKFKNEKRAFHLVYLYLSYLLYNHIMAGEICGNDFDKHYLKVDCAFSSIINAFCYSSSSDSADDDPSKLLWLNYLFILLELPFSESHFKVVYETLRHICVTFNSTDPIFIHHLINAFAELIVPQDRLYFLIELCKLNPNNANLIIKVVNLALQQSKKEAIWSLITHIIYEKKVRIQCFEFWKIVISLSIERNDHLNTHKFFQIAISLIPFNVLLWEMIKNYETSINHCEHLNQLKQFYTDTLQMTAAIF